MTVLCTKKIFSFFKIKKNFLFSFNRWLLIFSYPVIIKTKQKPQIAQKLYASNSHHQQHVIRSNYAFVHLITNVHFLRVFFLILIRFYLISKFFLQNAFITAMEHNSIGCWNYYVTHISCRISTKIVSIDLNFNEIFFLPRFALISS